MNRIFRIMRRLRSRRGCPWDRKQTLRSLKRCVLEEAHEIIDAIDSGKRERIEEELGDMLCVISLLIAIGEERRVLDGQRLVRATVRKMVSRHPHVFGKERAETAREALRIFQKIKERERREKRESLFADLGNSLPALMAAEKVQRKVARVGFDWPGAREVLPKVEEELAELKKVLGKKGRARLREEIGDFLFAVVNLARKLGVEPETALLEANAKFIGRFKKLEREALEEGIDLFRSPIALDRLDVLWARIKAREKRKI